MKKVLFLAVILFTAICSNAQVKVYAKFVPAPGTGSLVIIDENPGTTHAGQILLTTVSSSEANRVTLGTGTSGAGGGRVSFDSLILSKPISINSPAFFKMMCTGTHYKYIEVSYYNAADQIIYRQTLGTVFTTSIARTAASCASGCPGVIENITLAYGVEVFTFYTTPGNLATGISNGWDQIKNITVSNPSNITQ